MVLINLLVKRETGANPVRSRHCKSGVRKHGIGQSLGIREDAFER